MLSNVLAPPPTSHLVSVFHADPEMRALPVHSSFPTAACWLDGCNCSSSSSGDRIIGACFITIIFKFSFTCVYNNQLEYCTQMHLFSPLLSCQSLLQLDEEQQAIFMQRCTMNIHSYIRFVVHELGNGFFLQTLITQVFYFLAYSR